MRKSLLLSFCVLFSLILQAQISKSVYVTTAGTLAKHLNESDRTNLINLSVAGNIDSRDIAFIRDHIKKVSSLNFTDAIINSYSGTDGTNTGTQASYPANEFPAYAFYNPALLSYKPSLTMITLPPTIKSIGELAFYYCWNLTSINVPASVKSIGEYAFYGCYALSSFSVNSSNTRYSSSNGVLFNKTQDTLLVCPNAKTGSYTIPSTVKHIANSAFENCYSLTAVTLPTSLISTGTYAFAYCSGIFGDLTIPNGVTTLGDGAFYGCYNLTGTVTVPATLITLGAYCFMECNNLKSFSVNASNPDYASSNDILYSKNLDTLFICPGAKTGLFTIPNSVKLIGSHAFYKCSKLTGTITIPLTTDYIGYYAFYGCPQIGAYAVNALNPYFTAENGILYSKSKDRIIICPTAKIGTITLPQNTISVDPGAFNNCTGITGNIHLPASLNYLGEYAFYNCSAINGFTVDDTNQYFSAADGVLFSKNQEQLYLCPLNKAGAYSVPSSVKHIGYAAFDGCSKLTEINLTDNIQKIGEYAFEYCTGISSLTIPKNTDSIGAGAFYACSNLINLGVAKAFPPVVDYYTLDLVSKTNCNLAVPTGSLILYRSAPYWGEFANITEVNFNTSTHITFGQSYQCFKTRDGLTIKNLKQDDYVEIYTLQGLSLTKQRAFTEVMNLHLPVKGIFIVKIGEFTEKIMF